MSVLHGAEFLESLIEEEKKWLSSAIIGMICANGEIDESESRFVQIALDLIDTIDSVKNISDIIYEGKKHVLSTILVADRSRAYEMMSIVASVAISDGRLSKSEERYLLECGAEIGFDEDFSLEISKVSYEKLKVIAMEKKLVELANSFIN